MVKYIGKRVVYMLVTLFLIAVLTFVLMKILPGSPFDSERFEKLTPQQQADALAKQLANGVMDSSMIENMVGSISTNSIRLTITVIVTFPIMCVYPFVQKYFMKGIMVGAVKG